MFRGHIIVMYGCHDNQRCCVIFINFQQCNQYIVFDNHKKKGNLTQSILASEILRHFPKFIIQTEWVKLFPYRRCSICFLKNISQICPVLLEKKAFERVFFFFFLFFLPYKGMTAIFEFRIITNLAILVHPPIKF